MAALSASVLCSSSTVFLGITSFGWLSSAPEGVAFWKGESHPRDYGKRISVKSVNGIWCDRHSVCTSRQADGTVVGTIPGIKQIQYSPSMIRTSIKVDEESISAHTKSLGRRNGPRQSCGKDLTKLTIFGGTGDRCNCGREICVLSVWESGPAPLSRTVSSWG